MLSRRLRDVHSVCTQTIRTGLGEGGAGEPMAHKWITRKDVDFKVAPQVTPLKRHIFRPLAQDVAQSLGSSPQAAKQAFSALQSSTLSTLLHTTNATAGAAHLPCGAGPMRRPSHLGTEGKERFLP